MAPTLTCQDSECKELRLHLPHTTSWNGAVLVSYSSGDVDEDLDRLLVLIFATVVSV